MSRPKTQTRKCPGCGDEILPVAGLYRCPRHGSFGMGVPERWQSRSDEIRSAEDRSFDRERESRPIDGIPIATDRRIR